MIAKIKYVIGELSEPLTIGKEYTVLEELPCECFSIKDDNGDSMIINMNNCGFLNGGSWEIINAV